MDINAIRKQVVLEFTGVCPGCQLKRPAREFEALDGTFLHCRCCRDRGMSRELKENVVEANRK